MKISGFSKMQNRYVLSHCSYSEGMEYGMIETGAILC